MHIPFVIVEFAIVLGIMVLVHEFGHFAVAKLCGVTVETFSIGMGPRVIGWRSGGTDYRISLLPLGGYVKMAGDEPGHAPGQPHHAQAAEQALDILGIDIDPNALAAAHIPGGAEAAGEFNAHPRWQRALIALAGPFSNFILSFVLLALVAHFHH